MIREGYDIEALHGDLTQQQRDKVMGRFREKNLQLLIATDVAARGIDVQGITHVINYELPDDIEVYTHRSGRTGRAGKSGISISIVTPKDVYRLRQIERLVIHGFIKWIFRVVKMFAVNNSSILLIKCCRPTSVMVNMKHISHVEEKFAAVEKEEILQRVAALEFDRFLEIL